MKTGPLFIVLSYRLEKPGIEPATHDLQGEGLNHCTREASRLGVCMVTVPVVGFHLLLQIFRSLDPVVQSIVSLTISLRHKFVKQISAKVTNTLLFFVEKM